MDWIDKINAGLKLITEGCAEQGDWTQCYDCPFYDYCNILEENKCPVPSEWVSSE